MATIRFAFVTERNALEKLVMLLLLLLPPPPPTLLLPFQSCRFSIAVAVAAAIVAAADKRKAPQN